MPKQNGVTLVETLITLAIIAVLSALAIPSFRDLVERRRLVGAAEEVYAQLSYAKTEALKRSTDIVVEFFADGSGTWYFGITDAETCDPKLAAATDAGACTIEYDNDPAVDFNLDGDPADPVLLRWTNEDFANVRMDAPAFGANPRLAFNRLTGFAEDASDASSAMAPGSVDLKTKNYSLQVKVSAIGRTMICSPDSYHVGGYPSC